MTKYSNLPDGGFSRIGEILKLVPVGATTWWTGVKSGRFPKSVKISNNITAWRNEDIKSLLESFQ